MMLTGELTVAPFAGVQMVTEGLVGFKAHGAAKAGTASAINARKRKTRRSFLIMGIPENGTGEWLG
jgi:hypothetical protein